MRCINGCMDGNTMILMFDGSKKSICEIKIGELIRTDGESCNRVSNIWCGQDMVIRIVTDSGNDIKLTKEHPIKAKNAWKRAGDVKVGDELCCVDGIYRVCTIEAVDGDVRVYNLELEYDNDGIFANNILVGDFKRQNSCLN